MPSENYLRDCVYAVSQVRHVVFLSCLLRFQSLARIHSDLDKPTFQIVSETFPNDLELECGASEELQQKKMAEQRYENLQNGLEGCTDEELERFERITIERKYRATAPATAAPREDAPAPSTCLGIFMPSTIPELRGRENLGTLLKRFGMWTYLCRCDSTLGSETVVNTTGTSRAELERLHEHSLVENSLKA